MDDAWVGILQSALEGLDVVLHERVPSVHAGLRPGLTDRDIDRLFRPLAPLVLPLDLRAVYRWHDGHDPVTAEGIYATLFYNQPFPSLEDALGEYSMWRGVDDLWNPLWFPAFGGQSGAFVTLGRSADRLAGPLWNFHSHDPDVSTAYDSILALVDTTTQTWREADTADLESVAPTPRGLSEHNPQSRNQDGTPRRSLSTISTRGWPQDWLAAAGVGPMEPEDDALVISVAEFLAAPRFDRPVRGTLRARSGSGDWLYARLFDTTGSINVVLLADRTENYREAVGETDAEVRLAPLPDRPSPMRYPGEQMRAALHPDIQELVPASVFEKFERSFEAAYLVSRVIPL